MDLRPFVDNINHQLKVAAATGDADARALAERLVAPLDAAVRLTLQDVLSVAANEITCELAPGSVEVRLRGRDPEFVVTRPPPDSTADDPAESGDEGTGPGWRATGVDLRLPAESGEGGMSRINLRMPDHLKARIEHAAGGEGLSVNAWLVRAAGAALERTGPPRRSERRTPQGAQRYKGWAR